MRKLFLLFFFILPALSHGQTEVSAETIMNKMKMLYDESKLDSIQVKVPFLKHKLPSSDSIRFFYTCTDTFRSDPDHYSVGKVTLDPFMSFNMCKIGEWTTYYNNGKIYAKGNYNIGGYIMCQAGGPNEVGYYYRTGKWIYWYEDGQTMAEGVFLNTERGLWTECGGDLIYSSSTTPAWSFYDRSGNIINDSTTITKSINKED